MEGWSHRDKLTGEIDPGMPGETGHWNWPQRLAVEIAGKMSRRQREHYDRLRSGERPSPQREFGRAESRVALVYPNSYHVGMSNLGFHTIYKIVNSLRGLMCDRFFPDDWTSETPPLSLECEAPSLS
jgi:hypothetical protein